MSTPLRNDPMWIEFEDHGFSGLTPYRGENTTYEGFMPVVDREYDFIGSVDRNFTKFVSKGMWAYYNIHHLYARFIAIKRHEGMPTYLEERYADSFRSDNYPVPSCAINRMYDGYSG
ncbi:hypothetical protein L798_11491 [Zootermopsis nevadensis]|uniref:Uncharacterized protein n=1 Tax=Zootermopsis nevadensis TaxID=136037 RepID=A0A067QXE3_ZOONE|nr:hypothetical protein L798_11491 [Zootermopsis nevadensis]